jgi:hypothetical protein
MSSCEFYSEYRQPANSGKRVQINMFLSRNETGAAIALTLGSFVSGCLAAPAYFFEKKPNTS